MSITYNEFYGAYIAHTGNEFGTGATFADAIADCLAKMSV